MADFCARGFYDIQTSNHSPSSWNKWEQFHLLSGADITSLPRAYALPQQRTMHVPGFSTWTHFLWHTHKLLPPQSCFTQPVKSCYQPWIAGSKQPPLLLVTLGSFSPTPGPSLFARRKELSTWTHHCQFLKKNCYLAFLQDEKPIQQCLKPCTVEQRSIKK